MRSRLTALVAYSVALSVTRLTLVAAAPLLALLYGGTALGGWAIAVSLAPLFANFTDVSISRAVVRMMVEWERTRPREELLRWFFRLRLVLYAVTTPLLALAASLLWPRLTGGKIELLPYLPALLAFGLAEANSAWVTSVSRIAGRPIRLAMIRTGQAALALAGAVGAPHLWPAADPFAVFAGIYLTTSLIGFLLSGELRRRDAPAAGAESPRVRSVLGFAVPLSLHDLSWWLRGTAMTLIVANFFDAKTVGSFFLASLAVTPFSILLAGADQALALDHYRARASGKGIEASLKPYRIAVLICLASVVAVVLANPWIGRQLPAETGRVFTTALPFAMLGILFHACYVTWVKSLFYLKRTVVVLIGSAGFSTAGLVAAWFVAPVWGIAGVAMVSAATFLALALYTFVCALALDDRRPEIALPFASIAIAVALVGYGATGVS